MQKASLVKGTRDFGPVELSKRNYIFDIIRTVFKSYGFAPLETPAMENLSTLTGKYGDEGDALLFRIMNNGDILDTAKQSLADNNSLKNALTDKGLRYDLTVPFARYTAMNRHALKMPFKRYQMQTVWRADRPQKGRYREFWQCDADTIGTTSLVCEMECIEILDAVFSQLNIPVAIHINHRKLLEGFAQRIGLGENFRDFTVAIDKMDKIGFEGVLKELDSKGINTASLAENSALLKGQTFSLETLDNLKKSLQNQAIAQEGINELIAVQKLLGKINNSLVLDMALARGLSYYTGTIFEVKPTAAAMGSIAAGGRYDDLTAIFGVNDISGIGISFGADRIFDILNDNQGFPDALNAYAEVIICPMDESVIPFATKTARELRQQTEKSVLVYPQSVKLGKQLDYANALDIKFAIIIGSNEMEQNTFTLKNLKTGAQNQLNLAEVIAHIQ